MLAHPDAVANALSPEPGMKIADFGSGSAMHLPALAAAVGPNGRVYEIDIQKDLLNRARMRANDQGIRNADFIWADLERSKSTNLADGAVSRVLMSQILFQLDSVEPVFSEAFRILAPGGKLLVVEWSVPPGSIAGKIVPEEDAHRFAVSAGFSGPSVVSVGSNQYAFLVEKPRKPR